MNRSDVPEPWASRMVELRLVDPRYGHDIPSMSALASAADLHTSTVSGVIRGRRKASPETATALARVLGPEAQEWLGITVELGPYRPPAESAMLTSRQRRALTELIRSMVVSRNAGVSSHDIVEDASQRREGQATAHVGEDPLWTEYKATREKAPAKGDE